MTQEQENEIQDLIDTGFLCPYCLRVTRFGYRGFKGVYQCEKCDARVGCHEGSKRAFGKLANAELRLLRNDAHYSFDQLWIRKMQRKGIRKPDARRAAYVWLAGQMGLTIATAHIGNFSLEQCKEAVSICKPYQLKKAV